MNEKSKLAQAVEAARGHADPVRDIPVMNERARQIKDARRAAYLQKRCTCGAGFADGCCATCWPV